ncbi:Asparaginase [Sphingomonas sp. EC-HK361]|uniref:asparaginase n=1 Tax=Sphingomonas sp. EC-HK361 TaxID=2038397 RepID=UPI0012520664|nr:asparaginase [Sphingomonas sp. EC-HK361]VVT20028.1 Asparaginase [Sphingomonas sp. EC-HK361]
MTQPRCSIALFATGGTIAMAPADGGGVAPSHGADALAAGLSLDAGITLERHDLFAKPSASISLADVQTIADAIEAAFARGVEGAVVTHGTDTLEETAFALALMLGRGKPVVVTGAMRSAGEAGADGPANLTAAIRVAANPAANGQGPLVLFGQEVHAAHLVRKVHSSRPHAFSSEPFGPIGHVVEGHLRFELATIADLPRLSVGGAVPAVPVVQAGLDLEPETIGAFANAPIGALVIAGVGGGHVSARAVEAIDRLNDRIPVIIASRVGMGATLRESYAYDGSEIDLARRGILNAGRWRPAQARLLTQLALSQGQDRAALADLLAF